MSAPIRPEVHALSDFDEPEKLTLRQAVEWYKRFEPTGSLGMLNELESSYVNKRWIALMEAVAGREGVPTGWLSYMLSDLAVSEMRLGRTAKQEAAAALQYGSGE